MNACAEPYGVSRSAGASRRCRPWYSAASQSRRQRQFIASSAEAKAPTTRGYHHAQLRSRSRGNHGSKPVARPGAFEQRTEEHHLYHLNLPKIPLLSRVKILKSPGKVAVRR